MICDGVVHCPFTEADEAHYVCSPWHLKLIAIGMILATYAVAVGVTIYLICVKADQLEAERIPQQVPTQRERTQLRSAFDLTRIYLKSPVPTNEDKMRKLLEFKSKCCFHHNLNCCECQKTESTDHEGSLKGGKRSER